MNESLLAQMLAARILIVDDVEANVLLLQNMLRQQGYSDVHTMTDSRQVAAAHRAEPFDLILLDLQMPYLDGIAVMDQLAAVPDEDFLPVIVVTASSDQDNYLKALQRGARDYIRKPYATAETIQRIRNYLEVRVLYRERRRQAEILEKRVQEQVAQIDRVSRLKRFFSPHLAELIVAGGVDDPLRTHRREITVVSVDLRGFTAFTERAEPEEVISVLHEYHAAMGQLILAYEGTIEYFAGDGMMVLFNDPLPLPDPAARAARMALEMQAVFAGLTAEWRRHGFELGMGIGIAQGYATIGAIGFEGRWDYGAVGSVTNLAARLCAEAQAGQILTDRKVQRSIEALFESRAAGDLALKGFMQPVPVYAVERMREGTVEGRSL